MDLRDATTAKPDNVKTMSNDIVDFLKRLGLAVRLNFRRVVSFRGALMARERTIDEFNSIMEEMRSFRRGKLA